MSGPSTDQMLETLWTKAEIERVMLNFGRALDLGDWPLYRSCFAERFRVNFERLTGFPEVHVDADLWTRFAELILSPVRRHHQYSNFSATIHGERAEAIIYMDARHWQTRHTAAGRRQLAGVKRHDEVWVVQIGQDAHLGVEALQDRRRQIVVHRQDLDRHSPPHEQVFAEENRVRR